MDSVGAKLKVIRTATGHSKNSYADHLGVSVRTLTRWENGQIAVPDDVVGQMYEDLDLLLDVIHHQQSSGQLEVVKHQEQLPGDLRFRGCTVQMWNTCLVYGLLDADINGNGISASWAKNPV